LLIYDNLQWRRKYDAVVSASIENGNAEIREAAKREAALQSSVDLIVQLIQQLMQRRDQ